MMELYFLATGVKRNMDLFEARLNTIPMDIPFTDLKTGIDYKQSIFPMLQEIKLYRYIFPKEYRDNVLNTLEFPVDKEKEHYSAFNLQALALRKIMNAQKIPMPDKTAIPFKIFKENIALKPIGIKEDLMQEHKDGTFHEGI